jgi:hypothetical protein
MRRDIHVPNESDGFLFTSSSMRGRGISPGAAAWTAAVNAGDLLPLAVESEDSANVRVVVAEPLQEDEPTDWVGIVRSSLRVPDGSLALCGGIAYVLESNAWAVEHVRVVDIPAGLYQATLYCYASAPNGRLSVERSGSDEPLGTWFRRTRPGEIMPVWLHNLCVNDPSADPGHAAEWRRAREKRGGTVIDFLLHLEATDGAMTIAPATADGFMEATECRRPEMFPMGVPAIGLDSTGAQDDAHEPRAAEIDSTVPRAASDPLPVAGAAVDVPVTKLARVAQIAWLCHPYTHPTLRLTFPGTPPRLALDEIEDVTVTSSGHELRIDFANNGQPAGALTPLALVAKQLGGVPDGTIVDIEIAPKTSNPVGAHRYCGAVRQGSWQIESSMPPGDGATLREALALTETIETGRRVMTRSEEEAATLERGMTRALADYFGGNALQTTGAELALRRRDPVLFRHVVAYVFRSRYANTWTIHDEA